MDVPTNCLLSINCMTYNQSSYITDAMNGFVMQQTNFPFVAVIIDDASTDGEQEVIGKYINEHFDHSPESGFKEWETEDAFWTFARHSENKSCHFVVVYLKKNLWKDPDKKAEVVKDWCKAKYIALCEGDDYWIDPQKLQTQVDFLENHEDYSMCFHAADVKYVGECASSFRNGTHFSDLKNREYTSTEVMSNWMVPTASIVYKRALVDSYQIKHPEWLVFGDIVLALKCTHTGKIFGMSRMMSVYRIQPNSVTNDSGFINANLLRLPEHYRCLRKNFPQVGQGPLEWDISNSYYVRMKLQHNPLLKLRDFFMAFWWNPRYVLGKIKGYATR